MTSGLFARFSAVLLLMAVGIGQSVASPIEVAGVKVRLMDDQGSATVSAEATGKHRLRVKVDPRSQETPLNVGVELPISGRNAWPAADVEVLDAQGQAVSVKHVGIEWHKLLITVPAKPAAYLVHVADAPTARLRPLPESARHVTEAKTGLSATICRWFHGRRAALSLRFDDSHPTHLSKAIPILNEHGFRGTFMVNPGNHPAGSRRRSAFQEHRSEWEAVARSGSHELANHSLHHRGAQNDVDMEEQVGGASQAIWALSPGKSKLLALNLGGGTSWETTRTLRYYLDKYHLFDASSGSLGMDDVYGNRAAAFRQQLERSIQAERWCRVHFHYIGTGLSSSEENFRAALEVAKEHEPQLWIAGMADIYKYQTEREHAELTVASPDTRTVLLTLTCATDPVLYDQYLTIEASLPASWSSQEVTVRPAKPDAAVPTVTVTAERTIRFDVPPITAAYLLRIVRTLDE